jgi:hypothetical protein
VIGPLDVKRLTATLLPLPTTQVPKPTPTTLKLGLDAIFKLGGVTIAPQGLGVAIPLDKLGEPGKWIPTLDGLGLAFDQAGITLAGMLARTNTGFLGQATIKAYQFQLGAFAAYDKVKITADAKLAPDEVASLAVFGVLRMTLGGPPFFVVTGVAAGFGVNRSFARPRKTEELKDNPLLITMQGNAPLDLPGFRAKLPAKVGAFWLAGGVKFVSYGFILGDALLYILLDDGFELGLLALARMEIPELLQINLAIEAGMSFRGEPTLYAKAALYDSWLLHKDCKITGGFALQVWPRQGDAVVTIGGYHPAFKRPERYPEVERLGFRWALGDTIVIKGGCYFAMTPREAMGGGRLEVEGRWGPLSAGFYAGVDGLIRWDPFYFDVNIEVGVWGAVDLWFGKLRFSLGVGLHVWGPPVGGRAKLDLGVFSIDIPFGDPAPLERPALPVARYLRDHLHIALPPGVGDTAGSVVWPAQPLAVTGGDAKRPLRLAILRGRAPDLPPPNNAPPTLRLRSESVLRLDLAIPATEAVFNALPETEPAPNAPPLFFTLANKQVARSVLGVFTPKACGKLHLLADLRPLALFGPPDVAAGVSGEMTTSVGAAALIDLTADLTNRTLVTSLGAEYSLPDEYAPLPLGRDASHFLARDADKLARIGRWTLAELQQKAPAVAARLLRSGAPLPRVRVATTGLAEVRSAGLYRDRVMHRRPARLAPHAVSRAPQVLGLAFLDLPPGTGIPARRTSVSPDHAGLARIAPPTAVPRSPLLAGLALHLVEAATRNAEPPAVPPRLPAHTRTGKRPRTAEPPAGLARRSYLIVAPQDLAWRKLAPPTFAVLRPAEVCVLDLARADAPRPPAARLKLSGAQHLRAVAFDAVGHLLADLELAPGDQDIQLPSGARRLALIGLGGERPIPAAPILDSGAIDWSGENDWSGETEPRRERPPEGRDPDRPDRPREGRDPDRPDRPRFVRGFSADTVLVGVAPRVFLVPGAVLEPRGGELAQREPLGRWPAAALLARVPGLRLRLPGREAGVVALHLDGITRDLAALRKVQCLADGEHLALGGVLVRGDAAVLWWSCRGAATSTSSSARTAPSACPFGQIEPRPPTTSWIARSTTPCARTANRRASPSRSRHDPRPRARPRAAAPARPARHRRRRRPAAPPRRLPRSHDRPAGHRHRSDPRQRHRQHGHFDRRRPRRRPAARRRDPRRLSARRGRGRRRRHAPPRRPARAQLAVGQPAAPRRDHLARAPPPAQRRGDLQRRRAPHRHLYSGTAHDPPADQAGARPAVPRPRAPERRPARGPRRRPLRRHRRRQPPARREPRARRLPRRSARPRRRTHLARQPREQPHQAGAPAAAPLELQDRQRRRLRGPLRPPPLPRAARQPDRRRARLRPERRRRGARRRRRRPPARRPAARRARSPRPLRRPARPARARARARPLGQRRRGPRPRPR